MPLAKKEKLKIVTVTLMYNITFLSLLKANCLLFQLFIQIKISIIGFFIAPE